MPSPQIDPTAWVAPGALVMGDVHVGRDSSLWYQTVARGDAEAVRVGHETNIQDLCMLHADPGFPCLVGNRVTVGHRAILHGCTVEDGCTIGMGAILLNGVKVGAGSVVGAGALVREGTVIPPGSLVVGSPAKVLRQVDESIRSRLDPICGHYINQARRHRSGEFPPYESS